MHDQTRLLVNDDQMLVFIGDDERDVLRLVMQRRRRGDGDREGLTG
jgi:hypothetical protein